MLAQDDLRARLPVLLCQTGKDRFAQQRAVAMAQRIPRLNRDALVCQKRLERRLLMLGMRLGLQNHGPHLADGENLLHLRAVKVGQSDGVHLAFLDCALHLAAACDIVSGRLMNRSHGHAHQHRNLLPSVIVDVPEAEKEMLIHIGQLRD